MGAVCQICFTKRTVMLKNTLYCERCDIYYALKDGHQFVNSLPIKNISQTNLVLCDSCSSKKLDSKKTIKCKIFQDYFSNIGYCKNCKNNNKDYIRNMYYRNFLLYRKDVRVFTWVYVLFLLFLYAIGGSSWITSLIVVLLTEYKRYQLSYIKFIFVFIFLSELGNYEVLRDLCFAYSLYRALTSKTTIFDVPVDINRQEDLEDCISRLSINENGVWNKIYKEGKLETSASLPNLRDF